MRPPKGDIGLYRFFFLNDSDKAELYLFLIDDRVRAISLAMGMVPILWTSTPDGGKFDSFGAFMIPFSLWVWPIIYTTDWRVAGGEVTGTQAYAVFQTIMQNGTNFPTGYAFQIAKSPPLP